jgi:ribosomal protein L17
MTIEELENFIVGLFTKFVGKIDAKRLEEQAIARKATDEAATLSAELASAREEIVTISAKAAELSKAVEDLTVALASQDVAYQQQLAAQANMQSTDLDGLTTRLENRLAGLDTDSSILQESTAAVSEVLENPTPAADALIQEAVAAPEIAEVTVAAPEVDTATPTPPQALEETVSAVAEMITEEME